MTVQKLHFAHLSTPPALDQLDIKHREQDRFVESAFTLMIIGSSHYIKSDELGFYELLSCHPIDDVSVTTVPLERGVSETIILDDDRIRVTTAVDVQPLSQFPEPDSFDIAYRFEEDAYTAINCLSSRSYETYHTYPEHGLTVYTKNTFRRPVQSK